MRDNKGKKLYGFVESFMHILKLFISAPDMSRAMRNKSISKKFNSRIMLAVTEVNGCPLCSYAHTKMALEIGMTEEEISMLLEGSSQEDTPKEELNAIFFASYYAECRSHVEKKIWDKIVEEYGMKTALGILGAIRIITVGNVYGIAFGSFVSRFKKDKSKRDKRTNIFYELVIILTMLPFLLINFILSLFFRLFKIKLI